jgi:hypothetical protein
MRKTMTSNGLSETLLPPDRMLSMALCQAFPVRALEDEILALPQDTHDWPSTILKVVLKLKLASLLIFH